MTRFNMNTKPLNVIVICGLAIALLVGAFGCRPHSGPMANSWIKTMSRLSAWLDFYYLHHDCVFPYDPRGPEYALFELARFNQYSVARMTDLLGADYLPFRLSPQEGKATDMQVEYINRNILDIDLEEPPIVLLVRCFDKKTPEQLLLIGSDLSVYEISFPEGMEYATAGAFLGRSLIELSNKYPTERRLGCRPPHPDVNITNRGELRISVSPAFPQEGE